MKRGAIRVGAAVGPPRPRARLAQGVGLLSEDRKGEGLALRARIADNLTLSTPALARLRPASCASPRARRRARWIERLGIRARGADAARRASSPAATSRRSRSRACSTTTSTCSSSTSRRAASTFAARRDLSPHRRARARGQGGAHRLELPARAARRLRSHRRHARGVLGAARPARGLAETSAPWRGGRRDEPTPGARPGSGRSSRSSLVYALFSRSRRTRSRGAANLVDDGAPDRGRRASRRSA